MTADQRILELAAAITDFLARFPRAADTAEGIAQWWIAGDAALPEVEAALEWLEREGTVEGFRVGNRVVFRARAGRD